MKSHAVAILRTVLPLTKLTTFAVYPLQFMAAFVSVKLAKQILTNREGENLGIKEAYKLSDYLLILHNSMHPLNDYNTVQGLGFILGPDSFSF